MMLEAARSYVARGWSVIPVGVPTVAQMADPDNVDNQAWKKPKGSWKEYQSRIATDDELVKWFESGQSNIAIVTGAVSGLSIVDIDGPDAVTLAQNMGIPEGAPTVKTGKGYHVYCQYQEGHRNFQKRDDLPGIDFRGEGGYVLAPPSLHARGNQYEWIVEPDTYFPDVPEWVLKPAYKKTDTGAKANTGNRNMKLTSEAGRYLRQNADATLQDAIKHAQNWNSENCIPPLDPDEVRRTAESIFDTDRRNQEGYLGKWPDAINFAELDKLEPQPPSFIIPGWLPCGYATLFAGHGGIGKSALALCMAVCMALGIPFFGMSVERRRVLYLSCEDRVSVLHWRLSRICAYLGVKLTDLNGWLDIIDLVGHGTIVYQPGREGVHLTGAYRQLAARMKACSTQVLMVDGISDTYDGNENARAEVKAYVNALLALIPPEDGAVLLIGHIDKQSAKGGGNSEGYSGSTAWNNAVRARWYLYPETRIIEGGRTEATGKTMVELQKSNLGPAGGAMSFEWDDSAKLFVGQINQAESNFDKNYREREEQTAILTMMIEVANNSYIPAASMGNRTAYHVLSVHPNFPPNLINGVPGRKRFWRHIEQLRSMGMITESVIQRENRHKTLSLIPTDKALSVCVDASNAESEHLTQIQRTRSCANASNDAGGYIGGRVGAHSETAKLPFNDIEEIEEIEEAA